MGKFRDSHPSLERRLGTTESDGDPTGIPGGTEGASVVHRHRRAAGEADAVGPRHQGALPLPQGKDAELPRLRRPLPLLRLRRPRQRPRLHHGDGGPELPRGRGEAGRRGWPQPARGDAGGPRAPGAQQVAGRGGGSRRPVLREMPAHAGGQASARLPQGPRLHRCHHQAVPPGLLPRRAGSAEDRHGARRHRRRRHAGGGPAGAARGCGARALRPLPRPRHVPHHRPPGPRHRLRRPVAFRRRPEIPELAGNQPVPQGPQPLRPGPGQGRHP